MKIISQTNLAVQVLIHLILIMPRKPRLKIWVGPMTGLVNLLVWLFLGESRWISLDTKKLQWILFFAYPLDVGQWSVFGCNLWLQLVIIAILSIPLFRFMRDGEMLLFTTVSLRLKKDETPIVLYSPTTNSSVYYVKKTENADLKSGDADIVNN